MNLSTKQKQTHSREHTCGAKGRQWEGMDWECGINRYRVDRLLHRGWRNNKVQLYSIGSYIQ